MEDSDPLTFSFSSIITSVIEKAKQDGIITDEESELIAQIEFDVKNTEKQLEEAIMDKPTRSVLEKIFQSAGERMVKNALSIARKDTSISLEEKEIIAQVLASFEELGWDTTNWRKKRIWFVFKIVVYIDENTIIGELLDTFETKFCMRNVDPVTGICLGTTHYVIDDIDVTLLAFTLDPRNEMKWVRKGAFSFLSFNDPVVFKNDLRRTAQDLLAKHYNPNKIAVS
ncbi:MAG: tellurite resistance TerB family protein [Candidatus Kariarchaeaceae archaeon]|jgi:hypothetical protein